ncbi:MAG: DUF1501 domain-containing protein [Sandaracinaceae bacterium]
MKNDKKSPGGRRSFLKNVMFAGGGAAALAAGGLGPLSRLARGADGPDDRFYVFAYFGGGWDTLLGIDPRDPSVFNADNMGQTRIQPGYGQQAAAQFQEAPQRTSNGILLGPAAQPLARVSERLAIVRGISMDTLTHEVGRRRFITGKPPSGLNARGSAASAYLAAQFGGSRLIPNLSVRVESFNPDLPTDVSALRVGNASDLVALLRRGDPGLDPAIDTAVADMLADEATCARAQASPLMRAAESSRQRMRAVLDADIQALFDFRAAPGEIEDPELRAKMELLNTHFELDDTSQAQAALAGQALANGVARVVTFQAAGGLDTHFDDWEDEQASRQYNGFESIARLAEFLEAVPCGDSGESMLDRTTIVAFSEFMRTPLLNARGGRDHWLTNSCMLLGGNINPGEYGNASDIGMSPQPMMLESGDPMPGVEETDDLSISVIRPENILQTLFTDAGMDPEEDRADMRVPPIPALLRS